MYDFKSTRDNMRGEIRAICRTLRQEIASAQTEEQRQALRQLLEKIEQNNKHLLREGETF